MRTQYCGKPCYLWMGTNYTEIGDVVNVARRIQALSGRNEILTGQTVRDDIINHTSELEGLKEIIVLPPRK